MLILWAADMGEIGLSFVYFVYFLFFVDTYSMLPLIWLEGAG